MLVYDSWLIFWIYKFYFHTKINLEEQQPLFSEPINKIDNLNNNDSINANKKEQDDDDNDEYDDEDEELNQINSNIKAEH